jgi:hypothetical protein
MFINRLAIYYATVAGAKQELLTATKVPGRKIKAMIASVFIARLSLLVSSAICLEDSATMTLTLLSRCDIKL